jgi:hypothetical protein
MALVSPPNADKPVDEAHGDPDEGVCDPKQGAPKTPPCLLDVWSIHEAELRGYLRHRLDDAQDAEELLQEVFLKTLRQGRRFCAVENARAWLFQVARNALAGASACRGCLRSCPRRTAWR